jgi:hypothetical protein
MSWPGGFGRSLLAILAGNAIYLWLAPRLSFVPHHQPFRTDWGLLADFTICVALFAAMRWFWPSKRPPKK